VATTTDKPIPWAPKIGRVHLFPVTFAPRERVRILHEYVYERSSDVEGEWVNYVTTTGALWNVPIGVARFTIRTPNRPWNVGYPIGYKLHSYTEKPVGAAGGITELVFEMKKWVPKRDLGVHLGGAHLTPGPCPPVMDVEAALEAGGDAAAEKVFLDEGLGPKDLKLCRNMVYAAHGMPFKDKQLRRFFYRRPQRVTLPYYYPDSESDDEEARDMLAFRMRENPLYRPSLLSKAERAYARIVKVLERRR
jgi:hypothetical protein